MGEWGGFSLDHGDEIRFHIQPHLNLNDRESFLGDFVFEGFEDLLLLFLLCFDDAVPFLRIIGALEEFGNICFQHLDQMFHGISKESAFSTGKSDQGGFVRDLEIVHIQDIVRSFVLFFQFFKKLLDGCGAPCSYHPGDKDVIAQAFDIEARLDGLDGSILTYDPFAGLTLYGRFEGDFFWEKSPCQLIRGQFFE